MFFQHLSLRVVCFHSLILGYSIATAATVLKFEGRSDGENLEIEDFTIKTESKTVLEPKQAWNYVNVRKDAYMFWWLYYTTSNRGYTNAPLIVWLQGGPGASSTGYGNFEEIGPLDTNLNPRNTSWLANASLLFIDNPVGTGFSYVTDESAYTTDVQQIAQDLLVLIEAFFQQLPEFRNTPLYIFSESYGGKMAAAFSQLLYKSSSSVKCDFRGFAMGDSWISPIDSVSTWGPYLYATSLIDDIGLKAMNRLAKEASYALEKGDGKRSTQIWGEAEGLLEQLTGGVNMYNILKWGSDSRSRVQNGGWLDRVRHRILDAMSNDDLLALMNGPIRKKLGIIPNNVTWGGQSGNVFDYQSGDFMKPVVDIVSDILVHSDLEVVVYNGQLDLIVDTLGTEMWVQGLEWSDLPCFNNATRTRFSVPTKPFEVAGFVKSCKKLSFYWILDAGHMIPSDAGDAALEMLRRVIHLD